QMQWRTVLAKIRARQGQAEEAEALARRAVELIAPSDELDSRGIALLDLAVVLAAGGKPGDAVMAAEDAVAAFGAKGDVVCEARAAGVVQELRAKTPVRSVTTG